MIIDPGVASGLILKTVAKLMLLPTLILLTHAHWDHIFALSRVKQETGAALLIHKAEIGGGLGYNLSRVAGSLWGGSFRSLSRPDRLLHDGDHIKVGDLSFVVLHTPGHTPGGICLFGEGVVFSGDTLFNRTIGGFNRKAGKLHLPVPGFDYSKLMESIETKLMVLPDETRVLPGHGSETTIGLERQHNPFLKGWREDQKR